MFTIWRFLSLGAFFYFLTRPYEAKIAGAVRGVGACK